jgi:hypothetical protein
MKCVKKGDVVEKVSNEQAAKMATEGWSYCPKSEYRAFLAKPVIAPIEVKKVQRKSKKVKSTE